MIGPLHNQSSTPGTAAADPKGARAGHCRSRFTGFTLIELMIVVAIIATLAAIAVPSYIKSRYKAKIAVAISEIKLIEKEILNFHAEFNELPDTLSQVGMGWVTDPWGRPYEYLRLDPKTPENSGKQRRDKKFNPVNSDFDLYSMGRDGRTHKKFDNKLARDDIVRAVDGRFIDLAEKH